MKIMHAPMATWCLLSPCISVVVSITRTSSVTRLWRIYEEAVSRLRGAGYALWDILVSSERKSKKSGRQSSLDSDIRKAKKADIEGLVRRHPSLCRIVFVTGKGSADKFRQYFSEW